MTILFITVGSTYFDDLIECVLKPTFLSACRTIGVTRLIVQYGKGKLPDEFKAEVEIFKDGLEIEVFEFISGFDEMVENADVVISHAGKSP